MGLLLRPQPAAESPTHDDYGARDASPMPREEDRDSEEYDDDDDDDDDEDDDDDAQDERDGAVAGGHYDDIGEAGELTLQQNGQEQGPDRLEQPSDQPSAAIASSSSSEELRRRRSPEPRPARASRSPPRSPTVPKTTGVFAKLTDPGQYTGSHARRHGGGFADSPAVQELAMPTKEERDAAFRRMDYNGNGTLSLAEIDKAVVEIWPRFNHKRALMRAYQAADRNNDGFVERREFRLLLKYILFFNRLWDEFDAIDTNHDHRLDPDEFRKGCGQIGLQLSDPEAQRAFESMDENRGGYVLFDEFCSWVRQSTASFVATKTRCYSCVASVRHLVLFYVVPLHVPLPVDSLRSVCAEDPQRRRSNSREQG
jgi:Ca2+-binding EF-hand superfamily protein